MEGARSVFDFNREREKELASEIASTALKTAGSPDDVVRTVLFLASSPYITGQTIVVDGGRSLGR